MVGHIVREGRTNPAFFKVVTSGYIIMRVYTNLNSASNESFAGVYVTGPKVGVFSLYFDYKHVEPWYGKIVLED